MSPEGKLTFFRQSGWMIMANALCGFLMAIVQTFASSMPREEYGTFVALLRLFVLLTIPASGLQTVFAQQAAGALDPGRQGALAATIRGVLLAVFFIWLIMSVIAFAFQDSIMQSLKIGHPSALWMTLLGALIALCLPAVQGVLQGFQNFLWLGWSMIINGVGRLGMVAIIVVGLGGGAAGAMTGVFLGMLVAFAMAAWPCRRLFNLRGGVFDWPNWVRHVLPLTCGVGASLFVMNADMLVVQSHFPEEITAFYGAAGMIGIALVLFTTPLAAVMFPKVVRSVVQARRTDALAMALIGTGVLGSMVALVCTFFPELPLRLLYFRTPEYLQSAPLVPWFSWAMLPVAMSNVLIVNLLARGRYGAVPWLVAVAVAYGLTLVQVVKWAQQFQPFDAFQLVVMTLGFFSSVLLIVALIFTWKTDGPRKFKAPAN